MRIIVIFLVLLCSSAAAEYIPSDSSRSGLRVNFDFNSSLPVSKFVNTYSAKAGMSAGYMLSDMFIFDIGYEGLLNKNIVEEVQISDGKENAVLNSSFYYLGIAYKYNFNLRWALSFSVKAGYCKYWFELPYKDQSGNEINLDLGSKQIVCYMPELNIYYRVREWLDVSFRFGYPIHSQYDYSYLDVFSINDKDTSPIHWGICLHFGFY